LRVFEMMEHSDTVGYIDSALYGQRHEASLNNMEIRNGPARLESHLHTVRQVDSEDITSAGDRRFEGESTVPTTSI
jgi:hypothetical protein